RSNRRRGPARTGHRPPPVRTPDRPGLPPPSPRPACAHRRACASHGGRDSGESCPASRLPSARAPLVLAGGPGGHRLTPVRGRPGPGANNFSGAIGVPPAEAGLAGGQGSERPGTGAYRPGVFPAKALSRHAGLVAARDRATVGARGQGVVGEVLGALATPEGRADPYPLYRRLRAIGPAATAPDGTLVVTGYRECSMLLRDHRLHKAPERRLAAAGYPQWQGPPAPRPVFCSLLRPEPPAPNRPRPL